MELLNNREWSIVIWFAILTIFILYSKKMDVVRDGLKSMVSAFFVWQIQSVLFLMVIYMVSVIYFLFEVGVWEFSQIKNTIIWSVAVGGVSLFKLKSFQKNSNSFKKLILDNFKIIAVIEFVVNVYSFPLLIEMILLPILVFIGVMAGVAGIDEKNLIVKRIFDSILSFFGMVVVCYTMYMLFSDFGEIAKEKTIYDLFIPPLLTLLYLPFIFFMVIYTSYQYSFIRLRYLIKDKKLRRIAIFYSMVVFNIKVKLLERWALSLPFSDTNTHASIIESFRHILKIVKVEKSPPIVSISEGWSPYSAKDYLVDIGIKTGNYNKQYREWGASSSMMEVGDGMFQDNIAYYVNGSEESASTLKIKLNVNSAENGSKSHVKLLEASKLLCIRAINKSLPDNFITGILAGVSAKGEIGDFKISLDKSSWENKSLSGYNMKFVISIA